MNNKALRNIKNTKVISVCIFFGIFTIQCVPQAECQPGDVSCHLETGLFSFNRICKSTSWSTYFGDSAGAETIERALQLSDQGYVVVGRATQPFGSPRNAFKNPGTRNLYVMKFSPGGDVEWLTFLGEAGDRPTGIQDTGDGLLVVGTATSSFGSPLQAYNAANDGIVLKLDYSGNLIWHKYYGSANNDEFYRIESAGNNQYLVVGAGTTDLSVSIGGTVRRTHPNPGSNAILAMLIDKDGNAVWQTHLGGTGGNSGTGRAAIRTTTGYAVLGSFNGTLEAGLTQEINANSGGGADDIVTIALDADGNYSWHTFHGAGGATDDGILLKETSDGRLIVGGISGSTWGTPVGAHPDSGSQDAMTLFSLNSNGALQWNAFQGNAGASGSVLSDIELESDSSFMIAGAATASFGNPSRPYQGAADHVLGRMDVTTGSLLSHSFYGSVAFNEQSSAQSLVRACDGGYLIAGASDGNSGSPIVAHGGSGFQAYLLKLSSSEFP